MYIYCIVHVYMIHINDCIIVLHRYALSSIYVTSMVSGCKQVVMHWNSGSEPRIYPEMAVQAAKKYSMFSCTGAGYVLLHLPMFFINKMWKNTTKSFLSLLKLWSITSGTSLQGSMYVSTWVALKSTWKGDERWFSVTATPDASRVIPVGTVSADWAYTVYPSDKWDHLRIVLGRFLETGSLSWWELERTGKI
jgi:hypothetical protein